MKTINAELQISARGDREIVMSREFDAPRRLIYDAYTKPELLTRWLGVRAGWVMDICEIDLRVGGRYRWGWRKEKNGAELRTGGIYREIVTNERIVCTEAFEDQWYSGESLVTNTFDEVDGVSTLTSVMLFDTMEIRDGVLKSGMDRGVAESYDVLAGILPTLQ